ncbi:hypothetical protein [Enterobacter ludwigii]
MTSDIKRRIHAFRNALVLAADTRSHECFHMGRWKELNEFPHGCCDNISCAVELLAFDGIQTCS